METIGEVQHKQVADINQFEAVFNFATIGMIVTNAEGKIVNFNGFASKQFEYGKGEVLGKTIELLIPDEFKNDHIKCRNNYRNNPEIRAMGHGRDLFARKKSGCTFPVEVSLSHYTVRDETFVIAFVIDITVRKKQEEIMLRQKRELELFAAEVKRINSELEETVSSRTKLLREALIELENSKEELSRALLNEKELGELKSRFVTMASHEFRTPLSTILSSAYLLDKYNAASRDPKVEKHIHRIKGAVGGMKGILEDFMSLGRLEEGLIQVNMEKVSGQAIDEDIHSLIEELDAILKTGQKISCENSIHEPVWVDRTLLKNILTNLISNAIKFSNENGIVTISSHLTNDRLIIAVTDNGIGISEDDQIHLFERFFRAKNAANISGTGLGLHIVRKYLELMNGIIEISSKLNEGSTFKILIPQKIQS